MLVNEVMSSPAITVDPNAPIKRALTLLDRHSVTTLPVVNSSGTLVGVVSEADLVREALPPDIRRHLIPTGELAGSLLGEHTGAPRHVADVMTAGPVTVRQDTDLAEAAILMTDTVVKSLPVVDEHRCVVGVVSRRDLVRLLARPDEEIEAELDERLRQLGTDWLVDVREGHAQVTGPEGPAEESVAASAALTVPGVQSVAVAPTCS